MKGSRLWMTLVLALVIVFSAASPALGAPGSPGAVDGVRVWVNYGPGRGPEVRQALANARATFHYDFADLEAYVVTLPAAALNGIQNNPHVLYVEEDAERYPILPVPSEVAAQDTTEISGQTVPYGIDMVQAREVWDANKDGKVDGPDGSNRTVCIIDTGYYADHEDLPDGAQGVSQVDDNWARDGYGHGSHVGGTIAAENNGLGVVGVTPGAVTLSIVKIFDDAGAWTYASNLVNALNSCQSLGADVVSMSLGGTQKNRTEQLAFDKAYAAGVLSVAAAGNDGSNRLSYPASYASVVSVAAIDSSKNVASFSQYNSQVELAAPGVSVLSTVPFLDSTSLTVGGVPYAAGHIEFSARGTAGGALVNGGLCDTAGSWSGNVVLCERGVISFYDKVHNVQVGGGAAAVIYNNEPGPFLGTLSEGYSSTIIGISLSQEDGQFLVDNKLGQMATVSSTFASPGSGYEAWDGTSMATPHVSGVAALVWSANPNWTNVQIREALQATAQDLGAAGRDAYYGYGLVQAQTALTYLGGGTTPSDNTAPSVSISSPANNSSYATGKTITFAAEAGDAEDGDLSNSIVWTLGTTTLYTGASFAISNLPAGTHTITATVTDEGGLGDSDIVTLTVTAPPPTGETITITSLAGSSEAINKNFWRATVTVRVEPAVNGAVVSGTWTGGATASCTTDDSGQCTVAVNVKAKQTSITFTVSNVTLADHTYKPGPITSVTINQLS